MLANGQRVLRWEEEIDGKAGQKGDLKIPADLELVMAPFIGADPVLVTARFRYRINGGNLTLGVKLVDPLAALDAAFRRICEQLDVLPARVNLGVA